MMRRAERETTKTLGLAWLVVIVAGCFFLSGCGTFYIVQNEVHQEGTGAKTVALEAKGELDGEQNNALGLEGSLPNAGGLMDRLSPSLNKPTTIDDSVKDSNNPVTNNQETPPEDEVIVDEVDDIEEELGDETDVEETP